MYISLNRTNKKNYKWRGFLPGFFLPSMLTKFWTEKIEIRWGDSSAGRDKSVSEKENRCFLWTQKWAPPHSYDDMARSQLDTTIILLPLSTVENTVAFNTTHFLHFTQHNTNITQTLLPLLSSTLFLSLSHTVMWCYYYCCSCCYHSFNSQNSLQVKLQLNSFTIIFSFAL